MANPYGDVELDARGMRALAHPVRLAILTRLQSDGPVDRDPPVRVGRGEPVGDQLAPAPARRPRPGP